MAREAPILDVAAALEAMQSTLADADAELVTVLGGHREVTRARLWQGKVLVDWEPDDRAGDCLLRPELLGRLIALHADARVRADELRIRAHGRIVAGLTQAHHDLVAQLGGASRVELRARLRFQGGVYRTGEESYAVVEGGRRVEVLELNVRLERRAAPAASPRTSPAPT
jgi:hypothetical protein